jgi:hypothetical protein
MKRGFGLAGKPLDFVPPRDARIRLVIDSSLGSSIGGFTDVKLARRLLILVLNSNLYENLIFDIGKSYRSAIFIVKIHCAVDSTRVQSDRP